MLKENSILLRRLTILTDFFLLGASFFFGYLIRFSSYPLLFSLAHYIWILPFFAFIWVFLFFIFGGYTSFRGKSYVEILFTILKVSIIGFLAFGSVTYVLKFEGISRAFIILIFFVAACVIGLEKFAIIYFFRNIRKRGFNCRHILVIGTGKRAQKLIHSVFEHKEMGFVMVGIVDEEAAKIGHSFNGCKVLGAFKDLPEILKNNVIDDVIFVVPRSWLGRIEEAMGFCEMQGVRVHVAVDFFNLKFTKARQTSFAGLPLLTFESTPDKLWDLMIKRFFDVLISGISLLLLSPLFVIITILIKTTSRGPIFFVQRRSCLNGRQFKLYKFRTMVADAEDRLKEIIHNNEMDGPVFKMTNDPRLTNLGKFLRKISADELPQFWNVFKGDMSLIGPRPPIPAEVEKYDYWQRRRLSMKPGLSCLWQINGRNKIVDFNEWMRLDLEYIDTWSLWLDCKILFKTVPVVLFGIGAK